MGPSTAQLISQIFNNTPGSGSGGGDSGIEDVVLDSVNTFFDAAIGRAQRGMNYIISPTALYDGGKTYCVYQNPANSSVLILMYDDRYGLNKPVRVHPNLGEPESHHRPAIFKFNNRLYMVVEIDHNIQPTGILKARNDNDDLIWEQSGTVIPAVAVNSHPPTYPQIYNQNGILIYINQFAQIETGFARNSSGDFEGTWIDSLQMSTRTIGVEDEHYPAAVFNHAAEPSGDILVVINGRNNDVPPGGDWFRRSLIRCEFGAGTQTYRNWDRSFSKTSQLTAAEMANNCKYYDTGDDEIEGYIPNPCLDNLGNFFDIARSGDGTYKLLILLVGQSSTAPTVKTISGNLPGNPTLLTALAAGGDPNDQNGACMHFFAVNRVVGGETKTILYPTFRISVGGFAKPYMYKSDDLGDTWTEVGDLFAGRDYNFESISIPTNIIDIANNKNFMIFGSSIPSPVNCHVFATKAAFGEVQTETGNPFDDVTAYTRSELNALAIRAYRISASTITNTGTTLTSMIDQSPSAQNATITGSPVLDSSSTPTLVTLNGTTQRMTIPITGLTTLTEGTIIAVVKMTNNVNGNFLSASNNTVTDQYILFGKSSTNKIRYDDSNETRIEGQETVTDAFHIYMFTFQNGAVTDVQQFLDGAFQDRVTVIATSNEGTFFDQLSPGMTHLQIGALIRTTNAFYALQFKELLIFQTPLSWEQGRRACKLLASEHSITLHSHFT